MGRKKREEGEGGRAVPSHISQRSVNLPLHFASTSSDSSSKYAIILHSALVICITYGCDDKHDEEGVGDGYDGGSESRKDVLERRNTAEEPNYAASCK